MTEVYTRPLSERFLSSRWSFAYLFRVCWYIGLTIPPVYVAYSTGSFWSQENTYLEQPTCKFTNEFIVMGQASDGSLPIQYSTYERYNNLLGYDKVKQPSIKSWSEDINKDAKPDTFDLNLVFPMYPTDVPVVSMTLMLFFQVTYQSRINMNMNAMVQLQSSSGVAGNKLSIAGDLVFYQKNPISLNTGGGIRNIYQYPIINDTLIQVAEDIQLPTLMLRNEARNETMHADVRQIFTKSPFTNFNVSVHLTIPTTSFRYIPGPGETIKFAFIQWLAMFWIFYFFLKWIRDFVFTQNIVETQRVVDGVPIGKQHQF